LYTEVHYPIRKIPSKKLDEYLANGWFRMGQTIFTCWFLFMEQSFYSAIWIRQDLTHFKFKKRLRKILNRNGRLFTYRVGPAIIDQPKEELYKKHRVRFNTGNAYRSLQQSLLSGASYSIYDTRQIEVFDGNKLVAASFFDVGENSVASINGIFDPAYGQYSLGFYTMLLEMQFSLEQHKRYYYPGYIVPGNPRFDYKARIGDVDYFNLYTKQWYPLADLDLKNIPSSLLRGKLETLKFYLAKKGIQSDIYYFPPYESAGIDPLLEDLLKHPMYLKVVSDKFRHFDLFAVFDLVKQQYQLGIYYNLDDFSDWIARQEAVQNEPFSYNIFMLGEVVSENFSPKDTAADVHEFIHGG